MTKLMYAKRFPTSEVLDVPGIALKSGTGENTLMLWPVDNLYPDGLADLISCLIKDVFGGGSCIVVRTAFNNKECAAVFPSTQRLGLFSDTETIAFRMDITSVGQYVRGFWFLAGGAAAFISSQVQIVMGRPCPVAPPFFFTTDESEYIGVVLESDATEIRVRHCISGLGYHIKNADVR